MPKGYVILTEAVHDEAGMQEYGKASAGALREHGAKVLAVAPSDDIEVLEGTWHGTRTVVLEFASVEAAQTWYRSDAYQAAAKVRMAAADCNAVILPGFEFPGR
ncbi:MAG TPA: DUF1330 domain-containing protein [Yinghuangia sp.]|uniref:DUF1330 domain-containing protein n=1 Tax=Yinghuangia sp. YIM S10712 TaxID=3436930 RepID=UPI002BD26722|nr:DUF1330 domain-containing protein [Yinghuangia sp.]